MKKTMALLAMTVFLAACGDQQANEPQSQSQPSTTTTSPTKKVEQGERVTLYNDFSTTDDSVSKGQELSYVYKRDGSLTRFLLTNLGYNQYVKSYSVSKDEKTVMLDFKQSVMKTQLFQGSSGAKQTRDAIGKTFFANMPKLKTLQFRLNAQQEEWDHMNFTDYKRSDFSLD